MTEPAHKTQRWFCALLLPFNPRHVYWERDAGLLSLTLSKLGVESRLVLIGKPAVDDRLITATIAELSDPNWWRQWNLTGIFLYSWALPKFQPIARAIKAAGIKIVLVFDADGLLAPFLSPRRYLAVKYYVEADKKTPLPALAAMFKTLAAAFPFRHRARVEHLACADVVTLPSPFALQSYTRFLSGMGRPDLVPHARVLPYPVTDYMSYSPSIAKMPIIIAVGRWESVQKNTPMLVKILTQVLSERPGYSALVIGSGQDRVKNLLNSVAEPVRNRIRPLGLVDHTRLAEYYQQSQILLCCSHYETGPIAAKEALCCGCSLVGPLHLPSMAYLCGSQSGTVCGSTLNDYRDALCVEMDAWTNGQRDPVRISESWRAVFSAAAVAREALRFAQSTS